LAQIEAPEIEQAAPVRPLQSCPKSLDYLMSNAAYLLIIMIEASALDSADGFESVALFPHTLDVAGE